MEYAKWGAHLLGKQGGALLGIAALVGCVSSPTVSSQFSLSGQVDGLSGTVVLANASEDLTISETGPFAFNSVFAAGQSYSVSVLQQPTGQQCTLYNASGTFQNANVTNVQVSCQAGGGSTTGGTTGGKTTYSVGGVASDLSGAITLQNVTPAGTETIVVDDNGSFVFGTLLSYGSHYDVSIVTQPPGQLCAVFDGQGSVATADISTVQVVCRFSVGGIISGISGSVQLTNQAGDGTTSNLTITQEGAFQFPATYDGGQTYNVSVATQPVGQVCIVENGAGNLGAVDVTGVVVSCTTGYFSVGGVLSGLTGSQVGVQLNSGQSVSLTANGNFVVGQAMGGAPYTVSIKAQPSGQTCTVSNGSGMMPNTAVSDVQVACVANSPNTYSVGGTVSGLLPGTSVTLGNGNDTLVTSSGFFTMPTLVTSGQPYQVVINQQAQAQICTVLQGSGTVGTNDVTGVQVTCVRHLNFYSEQNASVVVGQVDFSQSSVLPAEPNTLNGPSGPVFVDGAGRAYVTDSLNNRILGYDQLPTTNDQWATFVLGQPTFTSTVAAAGNGNFSTPVSIAANGNGMVVTDSNNNRVLLYNATWSSQGDPSAVVVVGQTSFGNNGSNCTASTLNQPGSALVVGNTLFVADTGNNRILVWTTLPTISGTPASMVLGQPDFVSCSANQGNYGPAGNTLWGPMSVWSDGTALYGVDTNNNRILVWARISGLTTNASAGVVIGQSSLITNVATCSPSGLAHPNFMDSDGTQLFISDGLNSRILIYGQVPSSSGAAATAVLGASSLVACNCNQGAQNVLCNPNGVSVIGTSLTVADAGNNRLLIFDAY